MKLLKRTGIILLSLPILVIVFFVLFEFFGMYINHMATKNQTEQLQANLENEIPDIKIINGLPAKTIFIYNMLRFLL